MLIFAAPKESDSAFSRRQVKLFVNSFIRYSSYFHGQEDAGVCSKYSIFNRTESRINQYLISCPNSNYKPRKISRTQISWKPTESRDRRHSNANQTTHERQPTKEKVHPFLVFALVLPDHPYSTKIEDVLKQCSSMFPQVTIITGNAYEFSDLSSKYLICAYPSILFFKNGIFFNDLPNEKASVGDLAVFLSMWTKSFPQSRPNIVPVQLRSENKKSSRGVANSLALHYLEPFVGSLEIYQELEWFGLVVSAIYCAVRTTIFISSIVS